jgi:Bacterial membrane protein YfhO
VSLMNLTNHLQAAVWTPWILFSWARYRSRASRPAIVSLVLFVALQVLGGSPEIVLMTLAVLAVSTIHDTAPRWPELGRVGAVLVGALALALGVCAFQLLPTFEYFSESMRKTGLSRDEVMAWSLQPASLLQLLIPRSWNPAISGAENQILPAFESRLPWIQSVYVGVVPLSLAIAGAVSGRDRRLWGGLVALAIVLALGRYAPVFPAILTMLPSVFGRFRFPEKFLFVAHLGAVVLAAEGADLVMRRERLAERVALAATATFTAVAGLLLALWWTRPADYLWMLVMLRGGGLPADALVTLALDVGFKCGRLVLILATFAALLWLRRKALLGQGAFAAILLALAAADLSSAHYALNSPVSWAKLEREPLLVDPQAVKDQYVFHYQTTAVRATDGPPEPIAGFEQWFPPIESSTFEETAVRMWRAFALNQGILHGVRDLGGGDGFNRSSFVLLQTTLSILPREKAVGLLRMLGVAYLIGPTALDVPGIERVAQLEPALDHAYRIADSLPSAHLVSRLRVARTELEALNLLIRPDFRPKEEAVVSDLPAGWQDGVSDESLATVGSIVREPDRVTATVSAKNRAFLVLNDAYFPGWEAHLDGAPSGIYRTNVFVRGLVVPPGTHVVDLVYRPASFRIGAWVSIASLLLLVAVLASAARRRESTRVARLRVGPRRVAEGT